MKNQGRNAKSALNGLIDFKTIIKSTITYLKEKYRFTNFDLNDNKINYVPKLSVIFIKICFLE